jgi:hypothetical protein
MRAAGGRRQRCVTPPGLGNREIIVKSPDLCGLMDQLDDLFAAPPNPDWRSLVARNKPQVRDAGG